jgi:hypothetical protein
MRVVAIVVVLATGMLLVNGWLPLPSDSPTRARVAVAFAGPAAAAQAEKKSSHKIVRVTAPEARRPVEVAVAINPTNPDHVVAVSNQAGRAGEHSSNHVYVSEDGGLTWKTVAAPNPEHRAQGDDAIAFGLEGVVHRTYIAFDGIRVRKPLRAANGIFLSSSRGGLAWGEPVLVVDHRNTVEPFEDKPWLGIDSSDDSPHRGNIYVSWTRFDVYGSKDPAHKSHIYFARSRDGGRSFAPVMRISDKPGGAVDDSNTVEGAMPATGPRGEVYVAWAGPEGIVFDKSTDGGWTFGDDRILAKNVGGWDIPAAGVSRHNGLPVTAVDHSRGRHRGSVYVTWIDRRHGDPDVFLIASRDGGQTWSEPLRVNDDEQGNGKEQLFAWMAVDPRDGSVNIIFYDRRDLKDTLTGLTLARSVDGGRSFVNHRLDQEPFPCYRDVFFGDYIGVAAQGGRVVALYPHFTGRRQIAISAAVFRFKPGTQDPWEEARDDSH